MGGGISVEPSEDPRAIGHRTCACWRFPATVILYFTFVGFVLYLSLEAQELSQPIQDSLWILRNTALWEKILIHRGLIVEESIPSLFISLILHFSGLCIVILLGFSETVSCKQRYFLHLYDSLNFKNYASSLSHVLLITFYNSHQHHELWF